MSESQIELSVVSPVFEAEPCLRELHRRLTATLSSITDRYEIVLVEDCSPDRSWQIIEDLAAGDSHVQGLQLSRNFGQHRAIAAGLAASRGERVVVMDSDGQDDPKEIPRLLAKAEEGFDVVLARRQQRKDSLLKRLGSRLFFFFMHAISTGFVQSGIGTFSVLSRQVVNAYLQVADVHSHYLSVLGWLGFRPAFTTIEHAPRSAGSSSYSFSKLVTHALDGIASQSTKLLHISTFIGFLFGLFAFAQILYLLYRKLFHSIGVEGWASLMVVLSLVGGVILFSLGILGLYLGRMFEQTQNRPLYVVQKTTDSARD